MYTKRRYSLGDMVSWTRLETLVFLVVATVPVVIYDLLDQKWLHLPWLPIALIGTAVAFIISFQNNATYDRLWEARKIWGGITNVSRAWGLMVNDFITNDFTDTPAGEEELQGTRRTLVMRHVAWLTSLRHAMRQPRPWEQFREYRTNREWSEKIGIREHRRPIEEELADTLSEEDCAYVCAKTNRPAQILSLQSKHLRELRTKGWIEDFRHMELEKLLVSLLELQGRSERIKNFPYPRQYATLNACFLWIFVLLLPLGLMYEFDRIGLEILDAYPAIGARFVWLSVPFGVVVMWVFHTMERIGRVSENPFEGSVNDVPITTMARGIEIDLREMLDEDPATIPAPIEPKNDAQT